MEQFWTVLLKLARSAVRDSDKTIRLCLIILVIGMAFALYHL